ncbi:DJC14 protein, partial [Tricholaema leucomelas]|nr:DJC14 protein [Tricholaema leucomelas]
GVTPGGTVPGGEEEVERLVAMAEVAEEELNPFEVLGLELAASDAELRRAYRRLAVLVHPDKCQHPRAEEAFKVLRAAWDRVSSPERRREYERWVGVPGGWHPPCAHRRFEVQRDPGSGRYCGQCGVLHPAEEGDLWAESSLLGLKVTYLARMEGRIYDITEWAGCQRVGIAPDTHRVPYHISFAARGTVPAGRQR